jgi:hypothetical protein
MLFFCFPGSFSRRSGSSFGGGLYRTRRSASEYLDAAGEIDIRLATALQQLREVATNFSQKSDHSKNAIIL